MGQAFEFTMGLQDIILSDEFKNECDDMVRSVRTFEEVGMLTTDDGLVVTMKDGSEYQITVVKSN